jgi:hypothetical protein
MRECIKCWRLHWDKDKAAADFLRVTLNHGPNDEPTKAAREKLEAIEQKLTEHEATHKPSARRRTPPLSQSE